MKVTPSDPVKEPRKVMFSTNSIVNAEFNLTDSSLVETRTFDFGPNGSAEVPVKDARNFIQRAILKSGQSLVLSGFSQDIDRNTASSPFHHKAWAPFGSRNKTGQQTDLMIIITPRIIREI